MKSLSSALIFSDNFITSTTLSNQLRKLGINKIYECKSSKNALSILINSKLDFVFVDSDSKEYDSSKVIQQLDTFTDAEIIILGLEENKSKTLDYFFSSNCELNFLSKPISYDDVEQIIVKENTYHFFGEIA
tara:strand:- start:29440 stop:29835 length:396 start_codon:yes stop_codon:yes gene_type:complete